MANPKQVAILERGVKFWNAWRKDDPQARVNLSGCDLSRQELSGVNFSCAKLHRVRLSKAGLQRANFQDADLRAAYLRAANLTRANLKDTILKYANLTHADLTDSDISGAQIFGASIWEVRGEPRRQEGIRIERRGRPDGSGPGITADDLQHAYFISMLHDEKVGSIFNAASAKAVLVLGRFDKEGKRIVDAVRNQLRASELTPVVFDFDRPKNSDFTETVQTLAGMCRFVVAEISEPRSVPQELHAIAPHFKLPIVPILGAKARPYSMFRDLWQAYDWVLNPRRYSSISKLQQHFKPAIIDPAEEMLASLRSRKAKDFRTEHIDTFLS